MKEAADGQKVLYNLDEWSLLEICTLFVDRIQAV